MVQTPISVGEYLSRTYHPDMDYVDGQLDERNVGEEEHGKLQARGKNFHSAEENPAGLSFSAAVALRGNPVAGRSDEPNWPGNRRPHCDGRQNSLGSGSVGAEIVPGRCRSWTSGSIGKPWCHPLGLAYDGRSLLGRRAVPIKSVVSGGPFHSSLPSKIPQADSGFSAPAASSFCAPCVKPWPTRPAHLRHQLKKSAADTPAVPAPCTS